MSTIFETLRERSDLRTISQAIERAGEQDVLAGYGPITVFAPTDQAFERLSIDYRDKVLNDPGFVRELVDNHIVAGAFTADQLSVSHPVMRTNAGEDVPVHDIDGLRVNGARILESVACANGIIHVVDSVLVPYEREQRLSA